MKSEQQIKEDLRNSNFNKQDATWEESRESGVIKIHRWNIDTPIPVCINGEERARSALEEIERKLGLKLFNIDASKFDIEHGRGIFFSRGTASPAPGRTLKNTDYCANVSYYHAKTALPIDVIDNAGHIDTQLKIHVDDKDGIAMPATLDIIIHELGHALGLIEHFDGFDGKNDAISDHFWDVLRTLYRNPSGTPIDSLVINRAPV